MHIHRTHLKNVLLLFLTVGVPLIIAIIFAKDLQQIESIVRMAGLWGPIISISLFLLFAFTPLPAEPLALINGVVFGPVLGSVLNLLGNTVATFVEYFVGTRMSAATDFEPPHKKLPARLQQFSPDSLWFLIGVRFVPQFGSKIVSFTAGIYGVKLWRYFWTSLVANIAGSLLFALTGFGIIHL